CVPFDLETLQAGQSLEVGETRVDRRLTMELQDAELREVFQAGECNLDRRTLFAARGRGGERPRLDCPQEGDAQPSSPPLPRSRLRRGRRRQAVGAAPPGPEALLRNANVRSTTRWHCIVRGPQRLRAGAVPGSRPSQTSHRGPGSGASTPERSGGEVVASTGE